MLLRGLNTSMPLWRAAEAEAKAMEADPAAAAEEVQEEPTEKELTEEEKTAQLIAELKEQAATAEADAAKWKDEMLRSMADMENTRKRAQREIDAAKKYGVQGFAKAMLDVSDNLSRSLEAVPEDNRKVDVISGFYEGVELTNKILHTTFEKHGVKLFDPKGEEFDPNTMMALFEMPLAEGMEGGTVAEVVKTGFMLHDRVIRPA